MTVPIHGDFRWDEGDGSVEGATSGGLQLFVGGRLCWGRGNTGARWSWTDLLEGLSRCWNNLLFEAASTEVPERPGGEDARAAFLAAAHQRVVLRDADEEWLSEIEGGLYEWEQAHELSRFLPGVVLQEVAIYAVPGGVEFASRHLCVIASTEDSEAALGALGDQIAGRLDPGDSYAATLLEAWRRRHAPASDAWAARCCGIPEANLRHARGAMTEAEAWGGEAGRMARTVFLDVARACRNTGRHTMAEAFGAVLRLPDGNAWEVTTGNLALTSGLFGGGTAGGRETAMAADLRGLAGLGALAPAAPVMVASALGFIVVETNFDEIGFPGIVVRAAGSAPLLLLNARGFGLFDGIAMRFAVARGLACVVEASLAGENVVALLSTELPNRERHRLAIELLLPVAAVAEAVIADPSPHLLERLCSVYGVDRRVAAFQLLACGASTLTDAGDQEAARRAVGEPEMPPAPRRTAQLRAIT